MATILPFKKFDVHADCQELHQAFKDLNSKWGSHAASKKVLINILTNRSVRQRDTIADTYESRYGVGLLDEVAATSTGHFREALLTLVCPAAVRDAKKLYRAMKGLGTDEHILREIICSQESEDLQDIADVYFHLYKRELVDDIKGDVSGDFCKILCTLVEEGRSEAPVDPGRAKKTAERLSTKDLSVFIEVFTKESFSQLNLTFNEYKSIYGESILTVLRNKFTGEVFKTLSCIAMCAVSTPEFLATMLSGHLADGRSSKGALIHIIMGRCDIDLYDIAEVYEYKYGISLAEVVKHEFQGELEDLLLSVLKTC